MMTNPEILIIGAGPGGYVAAIRAGQLSKKVLLVDRDKIGGVCLNQGCIPTKALLHYTKIIAEANSVSKAGIKFAKPEIDYKVFIQQIRNITERIRKGIEYLLSKNNVEYLSADAKFIDNETIFLKSIDGSQQTIHSKSVIIATGSKSATIAGILIDRKNIIFSDQALEFSEIPKTLTIVGAGAIGLEFATIYQRLGCKVTVIEIIDQVLPGTDTEIANRLMSILKKQGINFYLNAKIIKIENNNINFKVGENEQSIPADKILVAVGRVANTENLGLENTNIKLTDKKFIAVNENFETSQKNIYAIGDIIGQPLLAHKAMAQGVFIAEKIAGKKDTKPPLIIPNCIYTDPELATIGLTENEAKVQGHNIIAGKAPLSAIGRAQTIGQIEGMVKIIVDKKTEQILGAHILAPDASNLISEITLAITTGMKINDIIDTVHPHPTISEAILEASAAIHKKAIHILNP